VVNALGAEVTVTDWVLLGIVVTALVIGWGWSLSRKWTRRDRDD
jgi:hypothetical protein